MWSRAQGSKFIGLDMSPIFPTENKPKNAEFIECYVLEGLPFPSKTFDSVHQKLLYVAFFAKQWLQVVKGFETFGICRIYENRDLLEKELTRNTYSLRLKDIMDSTKSFDKVVFLLLGKFW
ncbi:464_t:CDS:2 [Funneliformis mosseae]|uniref:464_t:CDS:1 n=1 Tax=Funneliformis mosseae TaxID=27381 RepID=A0A9N9CZR5_FUNMO|nr:464_t:CDS:2 [Funneliformis mosseae]